MTAGLLGGAVIATTISYLLVKVLTGIFDPAPTAATLPTTYLLALAVSVSAATALVVLGLRRLTSQAGPAELRDL